MYTGYEPEKPFIIVNNNLYAIYTLDFEKNKARAWIIDKTKKIIYEKEITEEMQKTLETDYEIDPNKPKGYGKNAEILLKKEYKLAEILGVRYMTSKKAQELRKKIKETTEKTYILVLQNWNTALNKAIETLSDITQDTPEKIIEFLGIDHPKRYLEKYYKKEEKKDEKTPTETENPSSATSTSVDEYTRS